MEDAMAIASLFKNGRNQAVRLPKELEFSGISEVEIRKEGNAIIITPVRKSWQSFANTPQADEDFLQERNDVIEPGQVTF
jgi:antitoxin VapB